MKDEGQEHRGRSAIRSWIEETTRKYRATIEAEDMTDANDKTVVSALVSGDFPGSPERILVTGGTSGMGEAFVSRLTANGGSVATTARTPRPDGQELKLFVQADVATAAGVQALSIVSSVDWGGIDLQAREMT